MEYVETRGRQRRSRAGQPWRWLKSGTPKAGLPPSRLDAGPWPGARPQTAVKAAPAVTEPRRRRSSSRGRSGKRHPARCRFHREPTRQTPGYFPPADRQWPRQGSIYALVALGYRWSRHHGADQLRPRRGGDDRHAGHHHRRRFPDQAGMPVAWPAGRLSVSVVAAWRSAGDGAHRLPALRNAPRLTPLITAIGMSIVLQNLAMIIWGATT